MRLKRVLVACAGVAAAGAASEVLRESYQCKFVSNAHDLTRSLWTFRPRALVLDMALPGLVPGPFLTMVREDSEYGALVVLACLPDSEEKSIVGAIELGADDFFCPPHSEIELAARLRALLRPDGEAASAGTLSAGTLSLDLDSRRVRIGKKEALLTRTEFLILERLMRRRGKTLTKDELIAGSWGMPFDVRRHTLDSHISNLRRKLGDAGARIRTVWGTGYILDD